MDSVSVTCCLCGISLHNSKADTQPHFHVLCWLPAGSQSSPRAAGLSKRFNDLLGQMLMGMGKQSVSPVLNNLVCVWGKCRQGWEKCEHETWVIMEKRMMMIILI